MYASIILFGYHCKYFPIYSIYFLNIVNVAMSTAAFFPGPDSKLVIPQAIEFGVYNAAACAVLLVDTAVLLVLLLLLLLVVVLLVYTAAACTVLLVD